MCVIRCSPGLRRTVGKATLNHARSETGSRGPNLAGEVQTLFARGRRFGCSWWLSQRVFSDEKVPLCITRALEYCLESPRTGELGRAWEAGPLAEPERTSACDLFLLHAQGQSRPFALPHSCSAMNFVGTARRSTRMQVVGNVAVGSRAVGKPPLLLSHVSAFHVCEIYKFDRLASS